MNRHSHLARASARAKAAELRGRVIRALKELLRAEPFALGVEGQPRKRREPSPLEVELFLQPKVANWPAEMRKYLFAHLSEILGGFRQQQQQQQQQQQEQQQQRREEPYPAGAPYSMPVPQQRDAEPETMGAALLRMLGPQAERSEANARESKRIYESLTEMDAATKPVALEEAIETPVRDEVQFEVYGPGVSRTRSDICAGCLGVSREPAGEGNAVSGAHGKGGRRNRDGLATGERAECQYLLAPPGDREAHSRYDVERTGDL